MRFIWGSGGSVEITQQIDENVDVTPLRCDAVLLGPIDIALRLRRISFMQFIQEIVLQEVYLLMLLYTRD